MKSGNGIVPASGRRPNMIKGLVPSLPERGKIKIGMKGATIRSRRGVDFQPPQKLDHFVVTTLERGKDGNFLPDAALMERLGDKPTEIPVRLLYDDPTLNFPTRLACFVGRTLWCAGDGETATRLTELPAQVEGDRVELKPHQVSCPCHRQDPAYTGRDKCKMNGALNVLIDGAGGLGGVWKFRTTQLDRRDHVVSGVPAEHHGRRPRQHPVEAADPAQAGNLAHRRRPIDDLRGQPDVRRGDGAVAGDRAPDRLAAGHHARFDRAYRG